MTVVAVDLVCGAGGFSEGLRQTCEELGYDLRHAAAEYCQKISERLMSKARQPEMCIKYRCQACAHAFVDSLAGVVGCPRCGSIDNHKQIGRGIE